MIPSILPSRQWLQRYCLSLLCIGLLPVVSLATIALETPLPVDTALHRGQLPNGVTYWVRSHGTPPGKITFWLQVASGSLNEADGQEGIAHYLEHLAFNGSHHFPPGELLRYFESIGLRFGQHQNAFTSFDQTTYTLTLPDTREETLDKGLLYLADVASGMLLTAEEINKERGIILEENRARKGVRQRLTEKLLPALLPGSLIARRLPIGLEESIARFQRDDFLAYYKTWYHPSKVTVLAVGDAPVATIVTAITRHFAAWQPDTPPPQDQVVTLPPYQAPHPVIVTDPELTAANFEMLGIQPYKPDTTVGDFRERLVEQLGMWMMNRRMEQRIREGTAPYQSAGARSSRFFTVARRFGAEIEADPKTWGEALQGLLMDLQQARVHGFTDREFARARTAMLADAERDALTEATRDARSLIGEMNWARAVQEVPMAAAQELDVMKQLLPEISLAEVITTFARRFDPMTKAYVLTLPEKNELPVPTTQTLLELVQETLARPVTPWQDAERPTALLEQPPQPGDIVERSQFAPLAVTHVTFANNVRAHYRFMDFKKDQVTVAITLPGGLIRESVEQRGITSVAILPLQVPATSKLSSTDIRDIMTGKQVEIRANLGSDAVELSISGTPADLEEGMKLVYLLLRDATIEPSQVALWEQQRLQEIASLRTHIRARVQEAAGLVLSGNDPRHAMLRAEQITARARAIPEAQAWLDTILRSAPMEVAIVGDVPEERALQLAATYFGSLPTRPRQDPTLAALREVPGFLGPQHRSVEVDTITPRAHPVLLWRCTSWEDVPGRRRMFLASQILERRVRQEIREERSLTYSTSTYSRLSKMYPAMSALYVEFTADPDKVEEAVAIAQKVVEQFAAEGPTVEEVETVRKQIRNSLETAMKEPGFWVSLLSDLEYHKTRLEDVDDLVNKLAMISREELQAEMQKTVKPEHFATVIARPRATPAASQSRQQSTPTAPTVQ